MDSTQTLPGEHEEADVLPAAFHGFLAGLAENDLSKVRQAWEPDGVIEFPYGASAGAPTLIDGVEDIVAYLSDLQIFSGWSFSDTQGWRLTGSPFGFLAEVHGSATIIDTGAPYEQDYIIRLELAPSGRIARWREYWDPTRF